MLCYIAARIYKAIGDRENELLYYICSACNDLMAPVNDYRSLHELAARLYVDGEIKRAYRYISRAIQDAMVAKSRLNITSINNILPIISASYDTLMQKKHRQLIYLLAGTCILAVLLVFAVSVIIEAHNRTIAAEYDLSDLFEYWRWTVSDNATGIIKGYSYPVFDPSTL